ncbi:MAG: hypothetical protein MUC96_20905 [Myxococcaceae bacterium]|jgi:hypothetical protein|nr:hypothetical protein [Myxococcaceae bacterium]
MKAVQRALAHDSAMVSELNRERASGLGRTGRLLEEAIAACATLKGQLEGLPAGPRRTELLREYAAQRAEAEKQRWNLEVQREAMGLRRHTDLDSFFPPPPAIRE